MPDGRRGSVPDSRGRSPRLPPAEVARPDRVLRNFGRQDIQAQGGIGVGDWRPRSRRLQEPPLLRRDRRPACPRPSSPRNRATMAGMALDTNALGALTHDPTKVLKGVG